MDAMSGVESETVPQFARDLDFFQKTDEHTAPGSEFENWDLPARPPISDMEVSESGEDKVAAAPDSSANPEVGPETAGEDGPGECGCATAGLAPVAARHAAAHVARVRVLRAAGGRAVAISASNAPAYASATLGHGGRGNGPACLVPDDR